MILFLLCSYISFSQTLSPKIVEVEKATHFCFSIPQSKIIAFHLEQGKLNNQLLFVQQKEIEELFKLSNTKDTIIGQLKIQKQKLHRVIDLQKDQLLQKQDKLDLERHRNQKQRFWTKTMTIVSVVLTGVIIIN